jgi:rhamnosyl/mannosyltransferase
MSALRILHVYRTYFPDTQGGLEEVVRTLALGARQQGFEVVVLYPSKRVRQTEETVVDGVRVCRVPELFELASCNVFVRGIGAFRRWAAWADLIHYHFPWPFADVLHGMVAARLGRRTVITYHSDVVRQARLGKLYAPLMWRFLNSADVVVSTSENYARSSQVLQRLRVPQRVIPIGLDRARLPAPEAERVASWRERVGEGFFFFVGVLRYYKGLDVLLRAVAGTALRVVIAGDGPERGRLGALAGELRLDNVTFTGRVADADKCALFSLARAFVLPSNRRSEAFGVALLEAMHFGLPLVTAEIGTGTSFVNAAGQTGLCVPPDDPAALRLAMEGLAQDDALRDRMGAAARLRLHGFFEAQQMVDAYCALYRELCPPTGAPTRVL